MGCMTSKQKEGEKPSPNKRVPKQDPNAPPQKLPHWVPPEYSTKNPTSPSKPKDDQNQGNNEEKKDQFVKEDKFENGLENQIEQQLRIGKKDSRKLQKAAPDDGEPMNTEENLDERPAIRPEGQKKTNTKKPHGPSMREKELREQMAKLQKEIEDYNKQIEEQKKLAELVPQKDQEIHDKEIQLEQIQLELKNQTDEAAKYKQFLEELQSKLEQVLLEKQQIEKDRLQEIENLENQLDQQADAFTNHLTSCQQEQTKFNDIIEELKKRIEVKDVRIMELKDQIRGVEYKFHAYKADQVQQNIIIDTQTKQIIDLKHQLKQKEDHLKQLEKMNRELSNLAIVKINSQNDQRNSKISQQQLQTENSNYNHTQKIYKQQHQYQNYQNYDEQQYNQEEEEQYDDQYEQEQQIEQQSNQVTSSVKQQPSKPNQQEEEMGNQHFSRPPSYGSEIFDQY